MKMIKINLKLFIIGWLAITCGVGVSAQEVMVNDSSVIYPFSGTLGYSISYDTKGEPDVRRFFAGFDVHGD